MNTSFLLEKQKGFTLIEIIAVLMILSIIAALVSNKFIDLNDAARDRVIDSAISELNGRENLAWAGIKISPAGWQNDNAVFSTMDMYIGPVYTWTVGPIESGGTIRFQTDAEIILNRTASSVSVAGKWSR